MSVLDRRGDAPWQADDLVCFYCTEEIAEFPVIHWAGGTGHIYFHPKCLINFNIRTNLDLYVMSRRQRLDRGVV